MLLLWGANIHVFGRAYTWRAYFGNFTVAQVLSRKFAILCHYVFKVMQIVTGSIYMFLFLQFVTCIGVPMIDYNQPSIKIFKQHDNQF